MSKLRTILFVICFFSLGNLAFAQDVVAVVSAESSINSLSKNLLVDIFLGKASQFPDGSQATPVDLLEGSSIRDMFYKVYAGKSPEQIKAHWSKIIFTGRGLPPRSAVNGEEIKEIIANNPHAIGYLERSLVDDSVKIVAIN